MRSDEKNERIQNLEERLTASETRSMARFSQIESEHEEENWKRDQKLMEMQKESRSVEQTLRKNLEQADQDLTKTRELMEGRIQELSEELDQTRSALTKTRKNVENKSTLQKQLEELTEAHQKLQSKYAGAQTQHTATAAEMKSLLDELEVKLKSAENEL